MTLTESPPTAEVSPEVLPVIPEVAAARDRLDRAGEFVTDDLRESVLAQAVAQATARERADTFAQAEAEVREAGRAYDLARLEPANNRLATLTTARDFAPPIPEIAAPATAASLALARAAVDRALASVPSAPPVLAYAMERAAFDSVPRRPGDKLQPPVCVDGDLEADAALQDLESERASIARYVGWWHEQANDGRSDALDLMARVADFRATCAAHAERVAALTVTVDAANASRTARRLEWTWPHGSTTTPAVEALAKFRRVSALAAQAA